MKALVTRLLSDIGGGGRTETVFCVAPVNIGTGMGTFVAGWIIFRAGVVRLSPVVGCITAGGGVGPRLPV